jgi:GntR family transcriptional regulator, rspAB operon transcriptional repressor
MSNYRFDRQLPAVAEPATAVTLTQRIYEALREEILAGHLRPGDRLVRRTLSKRLGVSPAPITEALLRLEVEGLVQSLPLYGCRVRPLTLEDVQNDQVLREAIECQAARLCAQNASSVEFSRLLAKAKLLDRMMAEGQPRSKLGMQTHLEFHADIARAGGSTRLVEELERVWFRRLMRLNWVKATHYKRVPRHWHQRLVRAIARRDPQRAEAQMRRHVQFGNEDDREALQYLLDRVSLNDEP